MNQPRTEKIEAVSQELDAILAAEKLTPFAAGEKLARLQGLLVLPGCNGRFTEHIENRWAISRRTAYNYIALFKAFEPHQDLLPQFTREAAYRLSAKSVPESVRNALFELAASGEQINRATIEAMLVAGSSDGRGSEQLSRETLSVIKRANASVATLLLDIEQSLDVEGVTDSHEAARLLSDTVRVFGKLKSFVDAQLKTAIRTGELVA